MRPQARPVLAAAALLMALPLAGSPLPEIRGAVYQGKRDQPVPGALIAIYDAGDLLFDSTYTRDDGGFRLRTPLLKGRFFIVATGHGKSRRADFDYDPAVAQGRYVTIVLPPERASFLKQAGGFLLNTLGGVFGSVVGLMAGLLFRRNVEEPAAARTKRDLFLSELRAAVDEALAQYPATAPGTRLREIALAVNRIRQLFERRSDVEDAFHILGADGGRAGFRALRDRLGQVERLLSGAQQLAPRQLDENLEQARAILQEIRNVP